MVNEGKLSRGCAVCRQRKIKCDEKMPACSYCLKKQIICPGYKSQFDLAWRDQNVVAEQSVRRRKNAEERLDSQRMRSQEVRVPNHSSLPGNVSQDFEGYAVNFFLAYYILLPREPGDPRAFLECLYPVWTNTSIGSPLVPAVTAVSSLMLEAWSQMLPAQPFAVSSEHFAKALEALRKALQDNSNVNDELLLAAMMLHMYENMRSFFFPQAKLENPHLNGISAIVKKSRESLVVSAVSRSVLLEASHQIVNKAMKSKELVPSGIDLWRFDTPKTPGELLDSLKLEVADLQAADQSMSTNATDADMLARVDQLISVDQRLLEWAGNVPYDWAPRQVSGDGCIPQTVREAGLYENHCLVYKNILVAETFLSYCSSRTNLHLAITKCSQRLQHSDTTISLDITQEMADVFCSSMPFFLGDRTKPGRVDDKTAQYPHAEDEVVSNEHLLEAASYGHFMAGRLAELLEPGIVLRDGQRQWIGRQLHRIRMVYSVLPT